MLHRPWIRIAAVTGAIVLLTTGCSLWGSKNANQIDPPQSDTGAGVEAVSGAISGTGSKAGSGTVTINMAESQNQMTLFAKDAKGCSNQFESAQNTVSGKDHTGVHGERRAGGQSLAFGL
jgi:germination protein M